MGIALSEEVKQIVDRANFIHVATLMPDGSPNATAAWAGREGDRIVINTTDNSLMGRNTKRDPRLALSMVDFQNPYEEVQLRGRVVERRPDLDMKVIDAISHKYTGKPFPWRDNAGRVALFIEIDKVKHTKLPFEHTPPK